MITDIKCNPDLILPGHTHKKDETQFISDYNKWKLDLGDIIPTARMAWDYQERVIKELERKVIVAADMMKKSAVQIEKLQDFIEDDIKHIHKLEEENRVGIKTLVQLKNKVAPNVQSSNVNINDTRIGSCTVGNICYNNQTESQCLLRSTGNTNVKFTENNECVDASNRNIIPTEVVPSAPSSDEIVARLLNDISKTISINPKSGKIF